MNALRKPRVHVGTTTGKTSSFGCRIYFPLRENKSSDEALVAERIMAKIAAGVKDDLLKGATIIMNKLDEEEIRFIYKVACNEEPTGRNAGGAPNIADSCLRRILIPSRLWGQIRQKLRILDP